MFKGSDRHCNSLFIGINTDCTLQGACEPSTHLTVATVCQHICNSQTEEQSALHKVDSYSYTFDHRLILVYSSHLIVSSNIHESSEEDGRLTKSDQTRRCGWSSWRCRDTAVHLFNVSDCVTMM